MLTAAPVGLILAMYELAIAESLPKAARQKLLAEAAGLESKLMPLRQRCPACDKISNGGFDLVGADCRAAVETLSGRELQIEYLGLA